MKYFTLQNGIEIPAVGCGTSTFGRENSDQYQSAITGDYSIMEDAIESGYRMFDTAIAYGNEDGIGNCIKTSGIPRSEFFIIGKIPNRAPYNSSAGNIRQSVEDSLKNLQMEYFDLFLIHKAVDDAVARQGGVMDLNKTLELWYVLTDLMKEGKMRGIGISNFDATQLRAFLKDCGQLPLVNEIRCNPAMPNTEVVNLCKDTGILPIAHSPLSFSVAPGVFAVDEQRKNLMNDIGAKYAKSWAQVQLRYNYQSGICSIPRSSKKKNLMSNLDIFDFALSSEEMETLKAYVGNAVSDTIPAISQ